MAIITKDELIKKVTSAFGESVDDDTLAIIEDVTDTLNDYDNKTKDNTNWKARYEENDNTWRKKYKERFTSGVDNQMQDETDDDDETPITFNDLFK